MADLEFRISDLAGADPLGGTEVVPLVQNGTTKIRAVQDIVSEGGLQAHIDASDPHPQYAFRIKNNLTATTDPTINNDSSEGYTVTSKWVNTATTEVWMCLDDTAGNARWETATLSLNDLGALALANNASDVDYDNTSSGLPTNVQGAIDQLDSTLDTHVGSTDGHPVATQTNDGFLSSTDKTKLDGIEQGATADQTKAEIDALGINADQVDGFHAGDLLQVANNLSDVQDATTSFNNIKRNASESYYGVVRQASTQEAQNGTAGAFPDAQGVKESYNRSLPGGTDLNTITQSGFYRLEAGNTNAPLGANYSQLLVIHGGGDSITQIVSNYGNGDLFTRSGNPPDVGGTGSWSSWDRLAKSSEVAVNIIPSTLFGKEDGSNSAWVLAGSTLKTRSKLFMKVLGDSVVVDAGVTVTLPLLVDGTDYYIYSDNTGSLQAVDADSAQPVGTRLLGGFHVYASTATINPYSFWDLNYRPRSNPRAMTLSIDNKVWGDIYLMDEDYTLYGYSRNGATIADDGNRPIIPDIYGGDGTTRYTSMSWWTAIDVLSAFEKRLPFYQEFTPLAYGVVERQAVGTDPVTTQHQAGHRSACGCEQITGVMWQWFSGASATAGSGWSNIAEGRGDVYASNLKAPLFGAHWNNGSNAGSRASAWYVAPSNSFSDVGARGVSDHVNLQAEG